MALDTQQEYIVHVVNKGVAETISALASAIAMRQLTIFSQVDHAGEARRAEMELPEEQLLVFGDPKVGTFLMQENPLIGIELPLKILVWAEDAQSKVAYPNVLLWKKKYGIAKHGAILDKMAQLFRLLIEQISQ